jgi:hypothetical protein
MRRPPLLAFVAACTAISACATRSPDRTAVAAESSPAPPPEAEAEPEAEPEPEPATATAALEICGQRVPAIGVEPCDAYAVDYARCIDTRMPPENKVSSCESLTLSMKAWRNAASSPEGRHTLAESCHTAHEGMKKICDAPPAAVAIAAEGSSFHIGVPACDAYLETYARCIREKMPEESRKTALNAIEQSADAWRQAAQNEAGREALAQACKTATEAIMEACK